MDRHTQDTTAAETAVQSRQIALTGNRLDARDLFVATREIIIAQDRKSVV